MSPNDAIFESLADPQRAARIVDAVNEFTRSQTYHKFTGQPKRCMMRRIMPPTTLQTREYWLSLGVPEEDLRVLTFKDGPGEVWYDPWWNTGRLFYEIVEDRLDREDYRRRLAARRVSKYEWYSRERRRRYTVRHHVRCPDLPTALQVEAHAYAVFGQLAALLGTF